MLWRALLFIFSFSFCQLYSRDRTQSRYMPILIINDSRDLKSRIRSQSFLPVIELSNYSIFSHYLPWILLWKDSSSHKYIRSMIFYRNKYILHDSFTFNTSVQRLSCDNGTLPVHRTNSPQHPNYFGVRHTQYFLCEIIWKHCKKEFRRKLLRWNIPSTCSDYYIHKIIRWQGALFYFDSWINFVSITIRTEDLRFLLSDDKSPLWWAPLR